MKTTVTTALHQNNFWRESKKGLGGKKTFYEKELFMIS